MATRWFQKQGGREIGPFGFQELAAMLRAGTLHEDDRVRMEHGTQWIAARDVLGLLRAAGTVQTAGGSAIRATEGEAPVRAPEDRITIPPAAGEEAPSAEVVREGIQIPRLKIGISLRTAKGITGGFSHPSPCPLPVGERVQRAVIPFAVLRHPRCALYAIVGLSLVAALATTVWALWQRPPIRPRDRTHGAQAPRPEIPSVPTLKENVATLVPGLEDVQDPYSPCLTANLRTIIFAAALGPGNGHHLCVAERGSASEPFGAARLIRGCASEAIDEYPSLTADGLELVFARREPGSQTGAQFYYSRRDAATREFGDAAPWPVPVIPGVDPAKREVERPQLLDPLHLLFFGVETAEGQRHFLVAERNSRKDRLASVREYPLHNPWPAFCVAESGLRAYFGDPQGLFLCAQAEQEGAVWPPALDPRCARYGARRGAGVDYVEGRRGFLRFARARAGTWLREEAVVGADRVGVSCVGCQLLVVGCWLYAKFLEGCGFVAGGPRSPSCLERGAAISHVGRAVPPGGGSLPAAIWPFRPRSGQPAALGNGGCGAGALGGRRREVGTDLRYPRVPLSVPRRKRQTVLVACYAGALDLYPF